MLDIKSKNKFSRTNRSILVKRILLSLLSYTAYIIMGIIVVSLLDMLYSHYIFFEEDLVYIVVHFVKDSLWLFIILYLAIGYFLITYLFFKRPYGQLQEIVDAARQLYEEQEAPVKLSSDMKEFEIEFAEIRMKLLQNERAAKDAEQRKNDLVVYLAHDLKTPLTSVIGYLNLLNDEKNISKELQEKYIDITLDKAERLEELINEFFDITRFNLTTLTLDLSCINIKLMLQQVVYEFNPILKDKNLKIELNCEEEKIMFSCDANKMQRVFDNLFRNAINYSYQDSVITIDVVYSDNNLNIVFSNKGNTIIEEKLCRIFDQFYRLDSSRSSKNGGAGLGLAITKEIVELHGGTIRAESKDNTITFILNIPNQV